MKIITEKQLIAGPAGRIELLLQRPDSPDPPEGVAVVCHPHSLYGGSLMNKVVHSLADTFTDLGRPTIRFNFRGVGQSDGVFDQGRGEQADLAAVVAWLQQRYPAAPVWLAGFSFGAFVAFRAHRAVAAERLLLVAPAVDMFDFGPPDAVTIPWLVIHGSADETVSPEAVRNWLSIPLSNPPKLYWLDGASHFFHGRLNELKRVVREAWR